MRLPSRPLAAALAVTVGGCGASHGSAPTHPASGHPAVHRQAPALRPAGQIARLPEARSGAAVAVSSGRIVVSGGLSSAGSSTSTVFAVTQGSAHALSPLPSPIHDASAAAVGGRLLVFGGGQTEGSDRIVQLEPGPPRQVARLPQPLSDLVAVTVGGSAYVVGGWNGSTPNATIYRSGSTGDAVAVGRLPTGVRYPAVAAVGGRILVAGGETAGGAPTARVSAFDPGTGRIASLPSLPAPIDHAAGVGLGGHFYVLGGLRAGTPSDAVLSWTPGGRRFVPAGRLPSALTDAAAVPFGAGIAVVGGKGPSGTTDNVISMQPP